MMAAIEPPQGPASGRLTAKRWNSVKRSHAGQRLAMVSASVRKEFAFRGWRHWRDGELGERGSGEREGPKQVEI